MISIKQNQTSCRNLSFKEVTVKTETLEGETYKSVRESIRKTYDLLEEMSEHSGKNLELSAGGISNLKTTVYPTKHPLGINTQRLLVTSKDELSEPSATRSQKLILTCLNKSNILKLNKSISIDLTSVNVPGYHSVNDPFDPAYQVGPIDPEDKFTKEELSNQVIGSIPNENICEMRCTPDQIIEAAANVLGISQKDLDALKAKVKASIEENKVKKEEKTIQKKEAIQAKIAKQEAMAKQEEELKTQDGIPWITFGSESEE